MIDEKKSIKMQQVVSFQLANELYGVDIMAVQEIIRFIEITKVPQMPDFIEGVINLRGNVIPVLDLRKRFGLDPVDRTANTRIIVVNVAERIMGMIVDSVSEVLRLTGDQVDPPPPVMAGINREYLTGIGKLDDRLLILLNIERILNAEEQDKIKKMDTEAGAKGTKE